MSQFNVYKMQEIKVNVKFGIDTKQKIEKTRKGDRY